MGPSKDPSTPAENQAPRSARGRGSEERVRRPRKRVCLLKGCERRPLPGMLLHIDGSRHRWFQDERWYDLIVILDDAHQ